MPDDLTPAAVRKMPAGRDLDRLVAERVMGWVRSINDGFADHDSWQPEGALVGDYQPSTDMAQAWKAAAERRVGVAPYNTFFIAFLVRPGASLNDPGLLVQHLAEGDTAELAICRGAVIAALEGF